MMDRFTSKGSISNSTSNIAMRAKDMVRHHPRHSSTSTSMDSINSSSLYRKCFTSSGDLSASFSSGSMAGSISIQEDNMSDQCSLTQAELEEYSRTYYEQQMFNHQKQSSYAQSEGYHSYVSSSDSNSATPFLDRLRQESDLLSRSSHWSQSDIQSSNSNIAGNMHTSPAAIKQTNIGHMQSDNHSAESSSSTETLKWLGSMSDVSVASSHATNSSTVSGSASSSQLIAHSSRVRTPKRHNSESVLYMSDDQMSVSSDSNTKHSSPTSGPTPLKENSRNNNRLFPVSTYTETTSTSGIPNGDGKLLHSISQPNHNWQSVADRINELERQHSNQSIHTNQPPQKYTYLDPSKTTRVPNPTLKAMQKNAVQSYFERQQSSAKEAAKQQNANKTDRPQSLQLPMAAVQPKPIAQTRQSLPNNYSSTSNHNHPKPIPSSPTGLASIPASPQSPAKSLQTSPVSPYQSTMHHPSPVYLPIPIQNLQMAAGKKLQMDSGGLQAANESGVPPPPPRRGRSLMPVRRTSSASEYVAIRQQNLDKQSLSKDLLGPIVMGPIISLDDWKPERPPKNPQLRVPSPELPPPPPANHTDGIDLNLSNQDDPLPPPPPEILRSQRNSDPKSASRRNSFAGSTSKKPLYRTGVDGMFVVKNPSYELEMIQSRPASSLSKTVPITSVYPIQINHPAVQDHIEGTDVQSPVKPVGGPVINSPTTPDGRITLRKRAHQSQVVPHQFTPPAAPPLKPRMPILTTPEQKNRPQPMLGTRIRCNSKASYLPPRQARDKLTSDSDHGSYKLTLNSNEDTITQQDLFHPTAPLKGSNLPDVLPVNCLIQQTVPNNRFEANNNNFNKSPLLVSTSYCPQPQTAPVVPNPSTAYSMKSMFHFNSVSNLQHQSPSIGQNPLTQSSSQYSLNQSISSTGDMSPKFMSQSTIDLKKSTQNHIDTKVNVSNTVTTTNRIPPFSVRNDFMKNTRTNKMVDEHTTVNTSSAILLTNRSITTTTTATATVYPIKREEKIIRQNSLKENIDKITQLQSKLMSAHLNGDTIGSTNGEKILTSCDMNTNRIKTETPVDELIKPSLDSKDRVDNEQPATKVTPSDCERLKLMQRTEIVLRLNARTTEAASQTDADDSSIGSVSETISDSVESIQKLGQQTIAQQSATIEHDYEQLTSELLSHLSPTDRLFQMLSPKSHKSSSDYVTGLYNPSVTSRPAKKDVATSTPYAVGSPDKKCNSESVMSITTKSPSRYHREMTLLNGDNSDLSKHKEMLMQHLGLQLIQLNKQLSGITEQCTTNDILGTDIAICVTQKVRPADASKFRSYIDDVGHITMLLLSLSGRLAKVENSLHNVSSEIGEKKIYEGKRTRLLEQLEEAKRLKDDIDRRGVIVSRLLEKHLTADEYSDYNYFVNMKAKLIVDSRELADRIRISEEQLTAIKDTLVQSEC